MTKFGRSIDEEIRRAMKDGVFDDLPGKGKPLSLDHNPHEDPAWRTAFRMLRSGGHTLPWIEKRQTIEADLEAAQTTLARSWTWRCSAGTQGLSEGVVASEWQRSLDKFREAVDEINQHIFDYNLEVPADQFKRRTVQVDREIARITGVADPTAGTD